VPIRAWVHRYNQHFNERVGGVRVRQHGNETPEKWAEEELIDIENILHAQLDNKREMPHDHRIQLYAHVRQLIEGVRREWTGRRLINIATPFPGHLQTLAERILRYQRDERQNMYDRDVSHPLPQQSRPPSPGAEDPTGTGRRRRGRGDPKVVASMRRTLEELIVKRREENHKLDAQHITQDRRRAIQANITIIQKKIAELEKDIAAESRVNFGDNRNPLSDLPRRLEDTVEAPSNVKPINMLGHRTQMFPYVPSGKGVCSSKAKVVPAPARPPRIRFNSETDVAERVPTIEGVRILPRNEKGDVMYNSKETRRAGIPIIIEEPKRMLPPSPIKRLPSGSLSDKKSRSQESLRLSPKEKDEIYPGRNSPVNRFVTIAELRTMSNEELEQKQKVIEDRLAELEEEGKGDTDIEVERLNEELGNVEKEIKRVGRGGVLPPRPVKNVAGPVSRLTAAQQRDAGMRGLSEGEYINMIEQQTGRPFNS
jgi:hypothetical protein